jgi:mono/diheme cytochrome c family protein
MKKLRNTAGLGCDALLGRWERTVEQLRATRNRSENRRREIRWRKTLSQNCTSCHGAGGEGRDGCCKMMSGPPLLPAVRSMNARAFLDEVRHVGETNTYAGHLLDLSSADVEAIRNYLLERFQANEDELRTFAAMLATGMKIRAVVPPWEKVR